MRHHRFLFAAFTLLLILPAFVGAAPGLRKYSIQYSVEFLPAAGKAAITVSTRPEAGRLIALDLNMPAADYSGESGDGTVERHGDRVLWTPPRTGGTFHYQVVVDHARTNGQLDARMTPHWAIIRGDHVFPPAKVRATKGSGSTARLHVVLPAGWDDIETPYTKVTGGDFAITNAERKFDRPVGWLVAGNLVSTRETIAGVRVTVTAPKGERADQIATMAILRQGLPAVQQAFGALPEKLLIVRSGDPMWRGGLSAPRSLWLHVDRPLLSENGTSPLLHELVHVVTDIRGGPQDDWIAEGLAEFYSLEIGRRTALISEARFAKSMRAAARSGAKVATLRAPQSASDRTRKAVALFAELDAELRVSGSSIDALTLLLMRRETVTLPELRADAMKLEGHASKVLASAK